MNLFWIISHTFANMVVLCELIKNSTPQKNIDIFSKVYKNAKETQKKSLSAYQYSDFFQKKSLWEKKPLHSITRTIKATQSEIVKTGC